MDTILIHQPPPFLVHCVALGFMQWCGTPQEAQTVAQEQANLFPEHLFDIYQHAVTLRKSTPDPTHH